MVLYDDKSLLIVFVLIDYIFLLKDIVKSSFWLIIVIFKVNFIFFMFIRRTFGDFRIKFKIFFCFDVNICSLLEEEYIVI